MIKNKEPIVFDLDNGYSISHDPPEYYRRVISSVLSIYSKIKSSEEFRNSKGSSIEINLRGLFLGISIDTIIELKYERERILDFGEIFCTSITKKKFIDRTYGFTFDEGVGFKQMTALGINPNVCYVYDYIIEQPPRIAKSPKLRDDKILEIKKEINKIDRKLRDIKKINNWKI